MTCSYCGSRNSENEHRCRRCGRRADDTLTNEALHRTNGALAAQLQPQGVAVEEAPIPARPSVRPLNLRNPVQRSLFQERSGSNVIPFETYAPTPAKPKAPRQTTAKSGAGRTPARRSRVAEGQGSLDFLPSSVPQPRKLGTTVDAVIFCEAPVAPTLHRTFAALLDWAMVFLAYGVFLAVYFAGGGEVPSTRAGLAALAAALPILGIAYGSIFAVAGAATPGMHWTHLRLTTFDGFQPDGKQRAMRFVGSCLSLCTVIGLLWSLADEECLAWQDHMSGTFPTPRALDSQVFRRA